MNRVILVKSCQKNQHRQKACVDTWAGVLRSGGVPVWFIEATMELTNWDNDGVLRLAEETDDYENNSLKLQHAIECWLRRPFFANMFIVDDDTFVHPSRWLEHEPAGEFECRLHYPQTEQEKRLNDGRPWATGGSGWYMSRRLCELYVERVTKRCSYDDVLATQIAQEAGVEIIDRPDLYGGDEYSGRRDRVASENDFITCHHVEPDEMLQLWEATRGL